MNVRLDDIEDTVLGYFTLENQDGEVDTDYVEDYCSLVVELTKLIGIFPGDEDHYKAYLTRKAVGFGGLFEEFV